MFYLVFKLTDFQVLRNPKLVIYKIHNRTRNTKTFWLKHFDYLVVLTFSFKFFKNCFGELNAYTSTYTHFFRCIYKYCLHVVMSLTVFNFPDQNKTCYVFQCGIKDVSEKKDHVLCLTLKCSLLMYKHLLSPKWQQLKLWPCFPRGMAKSPLLSKDLQIHT